MTISATAQKLAPGDRVSLYTLDLNPIGVGQVFHFTDSVPPGSDPLAFRGIEYTPISITSERWETTSNGPFPRPTLSITNVNDLLNGLLLAHNDLLGARVTRLRTFAQHLDGAAEADPDMFFPPDIYVVFQKPSSDKYAVVLTLASAADQQGVTIPRRKMLRDTCGHMYRIWNGTSFDYTKATCPYAGANHLDPQGNPTTAPNDECGLRLSDCKKRFPGEPLPTRAFPGLRRTTIQ